MVQVHICGKHGKNLQVNPDGHIGSHENKGGWEAFTVVPCPEDNAELAGKFFLECVAAPGKKLLCSKDGGLHTGADGGVNAAWKLVYTVDGGDKRTHLESAA